MIKCLVCNADNLGTGSCTSCGASLHLAWAAGALSQAEAHVQSGQYEAANKQLNRADLEMLTLSATQRDEHLLTARAFWLQGLIYFGRGRLTEAKWELLLAEKALLDKPKGQQLLASVLNRLGGLYYYEDDFAMAEGYYQRSSDIATQAGAFDTASTAIGNLGLLYIGRGDAYRGREMFTRAWTLAETSGGQRARANSARLLAWLHSDYGPYDLALEYAAQAASLGEKLVDIEMQCLCIGDAARVYLRAGEHEKAELYFHQAYDVARHSGSKTAREAVANYIAEFARHAGGLPGWFTESAMPNPSPTDEPLLLANSALRLAYYISMKHEATSARRYVRWVKDRKAQHPNLSAEDTATVEHALALLYSLLGEWKEAAAHFTCALDGTLSYYEQACIWEEYARMELSRAGDDEQARRQAQSLMELASSLYQQLGLPARAAEAARWLPAASTLNPALPAPDDGDISKSMVLIVDDNLDHAEIVSTVVEEMLGAAAVICTNGYQALAYLDRVSSHRPALIIMDIDMPMMDGITASMRLKANLETRDIPIIAITAHSRTTQPLTNRAVLFAGVMRKPIEVTHLVSMIKRHLK